MINVEQLCQYQIDNKRIYVTIILDNDFNINYFNMHYKKIKRKKEKVLLLYLIILV